MHPLEKRMQRLNVSWTDQWGLLFRIISKRKDTTVVFVLQVEELPKQHFFPPQFVSNSNTDISTYFKLLLNLYSMSKIIFSNQLSAALLKSQQHYRGEKLELLLVLLWVTQCFKVFIFLRQYFSFSLIVKTHLPPNVWS